jgi:hypothetical protein
MAGWRESRLFKVERKTAGDLDVDHHDFLDTTASNTKSENWVVRCDRNRMRS